jgi:BASS family bile acid:Na+ symporter
VTVFTIPFLINIALRLFFGEGQLAQISPIGMLISLMTFTLLPLAIGMALRIRFPSMAERAVEPIRKAVLYLMVLVLLLGIISSYQHIFEHFATAGPLVVVMTLTTMGFGYGVARVFGLPMPQVVTITFEVGVQNLALAWAITFNILERPELAVAGLIYAVIMPAAALGFVAIARQLLTSKKAVAGA